MKKNSAEIRLSLRCLIGKDGDRFIASDDFLDVVTQGESEEEALANFREAAALFAESCCRRGTLYDVLNESGALLPFRAQKPEENTVEIRVPLLVRERTDTGTCPD